MRSAGALARAALAKLFVGCGEDRTFLLGAMFAHVAPHQVKEAPRPCDPLAPADGTEGQPRGERHAEALDRRLARLWRCHTRILAHTACVVTGPSVSVGT